MKYVALLRGVNVGGNSLIKMAELKEALEKAGFTGVKTVLQSGNVIFESGQSGSAAIAGKLEDILLKSFKVESRVAVISYPQLKAVVDGAPAGWKTRKDIRRYVSFVIGKTTPEEVMREVKLKEGVDFMEAGPGAVYMTTLLSGLTKSGFTKIVGKPVYKEITMRNFNTVQKLLPLMEAD
jgi:uncharacterized protein (DUF1697 family)